MKDSNKTKKELIQELENLHSENAELKKNTNGFTAYEPAAKEDPHFAENVLQTLREALLVLDEDLKIISANRSFYQTFQLTPDETIGNYVYELGNRQWDIPELKELLEDILPKKESFDDFEITHEFRETGHKVLLLNARAIYPKYTDTKTILLAIEDITENKRMIDMLKDSEERYRRLFETANDGILLLEKTKGRITHANPATEKMLGYTKDEMVGNKLQDIGVSQDMNDFPTILQTLQEFGIVHYNDVQVTTKYEQGIATDIYLVDRASLVQCNIRDITRHKEMEREKERVAEELSDLYENAPCGYHSLDKDGLFTRINNTELSWLGYSREELIGKKKFTDIITTNSVGFFRKTFPFFKERGWVKDLEFEMICKDGSKFPVILNATAGRDESGNLMSRSTIIDNTQRKKAEESLRISEERFRRIFDEGPFGMLLSTRDSTIIMVNKAFCTLLGYSEDELKGKTILDITHEEDREKSREFTRQLFACSSPVIRFEKRYVKKDGEIVWGNITASAIHEKEGEVLYALVTVEDLTERRKAEETIRLMSYYDPLTNLPNITFYKEIIKKAIAHSRRYEKKFAIIYIGLDNFKRINDTFGYDTGDLLLKAVGERIGKFVRQSDNIARSIEGGTDDFVSRAGGDEFIILLQDLPQPEDAARPANRLLQELSSPYELNGQEVFITFSMGIALYPDNGTQQDELIRNAEKAMRYTKGKGINDFYFYSKTMHTAVREHLELENDLHRALDRKELEVFYQPKVNTATRMITGMEALIRWRHPDKGLIPPMQFIPMAETSGLILPIGEFVIRTVCEQIKTWQDAGYKNFSVALNVSSLQFEKQDLVAIIKSCLQDTRISPQSLGVELTESIIMQNPEKAVQILTELSEFGVESSIDDFGTGYSSLSYLKKLPVDFLKIDKSFIDGVVSDSRDQTIVKTTIAMAHNLNLRTIAEGVETEDQLSFLQEQGSDELQGYLFSKPVPPEEIPAILSRGFL